MSTIWIIHREAHQRVALARIAGAGDNTVVGSPSDRIFDSASTPAAVLLGLSEDFELELNFVHRFAKKLRGASWILLPRVGDLDEARRLFDTLPAQQIPYPPNPIELRRALRGAMQRRRADPLSSRRGRDTLRDRFGRWYADLELPELMRAIDPRLATVPILLRGEEGSGRTLLARYIHTFGGSGEDAFIHVSCRGLERAEDLLAQIRISAAQARYDSWTIWLEDVDRLPTALQRRVDDWIEFGLPEGVVRASALRWIAGAGDEFDLDARPGLDPRLAQALSGLSIPIPPLRERPGCIEPFVHDTIRAWCDAQGEHPRRVSRDAVELLCHYPWPGNLHELEALLIRTLSFTSANPLLPVHLRFPGDDTRLEPSRPPAPSEAPTSPREADLPEAVVLDDLDEFERFDELDDELDEFDEEEVEAADEAEGAEAVDERRHVEDVADVIDLDEDELIDFDEALDQSIDDDTPAALGASTMGGPSPLPTEPDTAGSALAMATEAAANTLGAAAAPHSPQAESNLRRLVQAVAHEVRNPLVSIRTFSELLPEHYDDEEFRTHFRELVGNDVRRIDEAVNRLQDLVDVGESKSEPVDVSNLLESLLDERREQIQGRRLLVLKELDHSQPYALGDPFQLRDAFAGLLDRALARVSDRGDIYIASKHHAASHPNMRVLIRSTSNPHEPMASGGAAQSGTESDALDLVMAETVVQAAGGSLTIDGNDAHECVIVIDLPAP